MNKIIQIISIAVIGLLLGCQSKPSSSSASLEEAAVLSSAAPFAAIAIPAYGGSVAIEGGNRSVQASSVALGFPDPAFARRVSRDELIAIARSHGWKFHEPWLYMGTRDDRHYFALYPFGGFRRIYSVPVDQWTVTDPFSLTAISSAWREIRIVPDGRMMRNLWILESDEPIRFFVPERDPITFFERGGQQISDGNAVKPPGDERTQ